MSGWAKFIKATLVYQIEFTPGSVHAHQITPDYCLGFEGESEHYRWP